eukprot:5291630-Alexandrium_andersonii.AAC.1
MSASLVGSEMCIRDSSRGVRSARLFAQILDLWTNMGIEQGSAVASARPVSYTHLTLPTICSV